MLVESTADFPQSEHTETYIWTTERSALSSTPLLRTFQSPTLWRATCPDATRGQHLPRRPYEINPDFSTGCLASTGVYYAGVAEYFSELNFDFVLESIRAETIEVPDLAPYSPEKAIV